MRIDIVSAFPEIFTPLQSSIMKRAQERGSVFLKIWDLRDFSTDRHKKVDDAPYGGGKGMVLACDPIFRAVEKVREENPGASVILTCPQGRLFDQAIAREYASRKGLIILCGHYEGVDERVRVIVDDEISIGDFVLTGGELPAMVIVDAVVRLLPGVLPDQAPVNDSFFNYLLDWPCYTRPEEYRGMKVPDVLLSGNHKAIADWRKREAEKRTRERRPDLYKRYLKNKGKP
jgi:tRNA (guanine37-N1)-methyltransferase